MGGSSNSGLPMQQPGGLLSFLARLDPRFGLPNPSGVSATGPFMQNQIVGQAQPMPTNSLLGGLLGGQLNPDRANPFAPAPPLPVTQLSLQGNPWSNAQPPAASSYPQFGQMR